MAEAKNNTTEEVKVSESEQPQYITLTEAVEGKESIVKHYAIADMTDEAKILFDRQVVEQDNKNKLINNFNTQLDNQVRIVNSLMESLKKVLPAEVDLPSNDEDTNADTQDSTEEKTSSEEKSSKKVN
tara:strand:- start:711 stop:1094 length:384 start_codon:yes stop_codon:yes gene_type:complete